MNTGFAISDIAVLKSAITVAGRLIAKGTIMAFARASAKREFKVAFVGLLNDGGFWKIGSHTHSAYQKYSIRKGLSEVGDVLHHWLIPQEWFRPATKTMPASAIYEFFHSPLFKKIGLTDPRVVFNQPWNYLRITDRTILGRSARITHQASHGASKQLELGPLQKLLYGTPNYAKSTAKVISREVEIIEKEIEGKLEGLSW